MEHFFLGFFKKSYKQLKNIAKIMANAYDYMIGCIILDRFNRRVLIVVLKVL